jgi:GAF domain-containing protein
MLEVVEIEAGGVYLLDEETEMLSVVTYRGFDPQFVAEIDKLKIGEGFSGRVAQSGQPLVVRDVSTDSRLTRTVVSEERLRSLASVPLRSRGKVLGTLFAVTRGYREFTDQDVQLLTSIGHQIGVAIENAHLFEAERRRRQEATLLAEMANLISGTLDLDEVLRLTAKYAVDVFDVHCCCIFVYDEAKGTLRPAAQIGFDDQVVTAITGAEFSPSDGMRRTVFEALQPLIVEDVPSDPLLSPQNLLTPQSALVVPIEVGGRRLGAMQLSTQHPQRRRFTTEEGELALALANQAAMAIDSARLFEAEQRRAEQFRVISEVGRRITSILDIDEVLVQVARLIHQAFDYYHVGIAMREEDQVVYKVGAGELWDDPQFQFQPARLKMGQEGIAGWVAAVGEPVLVPDVSQEPRYVWMRGSKTRSELAVPIEVKGEIVGVLDVQSDRLNAFDESDLVVLQSLAHQTAIAVQNAQLYEQAQQGAVLEERQRLARELHDAVTQMLFSASLIAETLPALWESDQEKGRQLLQELRQLSRGALAEMRTLLLELRPTVLVEADLGDLLRQLAEVVTGRTGVPVTVTAEGDGELPSDVHVALYRIAQETLNNVIKHARASYVVVDLRCALPPSSLQEGWTKGGHVELCIIDDGCGFDPSYVPAGRLGLIIMRERAQAVGATLEIDSQLGHGTRVTAVWKG